MKNSRKKILSLTAASAVFLMLALCVMPVSAVDFADNNETFIKMANGAFYNLSGDDYYFKFTKEGGGLNAIHISDSITNSAGGVYTNKGLSGTFYISDTSKNPGCSDSAILMFAVPENADTMDLALSITASGYNWTLTPTIMYPSSVTYYNSVNIGTFDEGDFLEIGNEDVTSIWRPYFDENYPMYYGQDMTNTNNKYKVMFIDLALGTLKYNTNLTDNGMIKVQYNISGYEDNALFDIYTWCNQSTQGQGVSWTNRVTDTGSSGWTIGF
ncbi:hypothetical protein F1737_00835 [Methanoplanus sp. FWC-SCC4]|uniref:Uncharacterized protein n=1 Tax=Methanochimaera problematica TaxID=2609417 RepID=A0AA97I2Y7_9EURY|nr:hypothetical protein [Methanoplanus sp. FWC-SCC4]WOF15326.1 hypothetical protein F1737_00835 [Methanoplanus sp. FWC-SCC4]